MIRLHYAAPYDWTGILNFLRPRAIAGVETVSDDAYEREGVRVTIVGQQVSVAGATTLMARIASRHGVTPQSLMRARTNPGMPQTRWNTIRGLARAVARGEVTFERGATLDDSIANLTRLPGIGPWTAHYIAMRALREPDAFPHTDLGIRKAAGMISDRELLSRAEAWRPYRAYATMLLWRSL